MTSYSPNYNVHDIVSSSGNNYEYIFTLSKDLSINNLLFDYDSLRRFVASEGSDSNQPLSISSITDISFISFDKAPSNPSAIDLNNNNMVNINRLYYISQLCKYFKIIPNRELSFSNLKLKDINNNDIVFNLYEFNTNTSLYEISSNNISSLTYTIEPSSNIVFEFVKKQSLPYSIVYENFLTDDIFNISKQLNIKWRIYGTTDWNYSEDLSFGEYSFQEMSVELQNLLITHGTTIFDSESGAVAVDISSNTYPNIFLNFHNKLYTLIEIDYTSSIFDLFSLKNVTSNIILQSNGKITLEAEYRPNLGIITELLYSYEDDIYKTYYTYENITNLITSIPNTRADGSIYSHNITGPKEIKLFEDNNYINITLNADLQFNYLKETIEGTVVTTYDSIYTNITNTSYDASECNLYDANIKDVSSVTLLGFNIDTSFISMNDISINNTFKSGSIDISDLFVNQSVNISSSLSSHNVNLHNSFINIDKNKCKYLRFDISGNIELINLKFFNHQDVEVSFNVFSLTDNTYIEENYANSFTYALNNKSIMFEFFDSQQIGLYFKYDTVDHGKVFALNSSNNKIYYQPNNSNYKESNNRDYKYYIQRDFKKYS